MARVGDQVSNSPDDTPGTSKIILLLALAASK